MNKLLLLALLLIPLIAGCESSTAATTDIAAVIPGIQWEVHDFTCKSDSDEQKVLDGIDWDPISIAGARTFTDDDGLPGYVGIGSGFGGVVIRTDGTVWINYCDKGATGTVVLGY
jgi:hypothetical protein